MESSIHHPQYFDILSVARNNGEHAALLTKHQDIFYINKISGAYMVHRLLIGLKPFLCLCWSVLWVVIVLESDQCFLIFSCFVPKYTGIQFIVIYLEYFEFQVKEKQPFSTMLPPPCFTLGDSCFLLNDHLFRKMITFYIRMSAIIQK